ncbi:MAG: aminodeoxychorismate/anthranilate synthase component II [Bacteroidia bacterium]
MILLVDNFDSFTYNLQDYLRRKEHTVKTIRYDAFEIDDINWDAVEGIVISPGPYTPKHYPKHFDIFKRFIGKKPIFGVCLGFQSIGEFFGAQLVKAEKPMHGKVSEIEHNGMAMFNDIESPTEVTRYHSLILEQLPNSLIPCAYTRKRELMAFCSSDQMIWGVQFHPEAVLTTFGVKMMSNWLKIVDDFKADKLKTSQFNVI